MSAHAGRLCLGYQYATPYPEPGPPPRRPTPPEQERPNPDWAAAQRREEGLLNRPLKAVFAIAVVIGLAAITLGAVGWLDVLVAGLGVILCALTAAVSGFVIWQGQRALRARLADERARVGKMRAAQQSRLVAWQAAHAARVREWRALRFAYEHQKRWYAVCVPDGVHLLQSADDMVEYQAQLDRVKAIGAKPDPNPVLGVQSSWDRTDLMQLARREIDTMVDLDRLLESTSEPILDLAPTPGEETIMRLGPGITAQIKHKIDVMNAHWRDYDRLFTAPNP